MLVMLLFAKFRWKGYEMKKVLIVLLSIAILAVAAVIILPYVDPYSRHNYRNRAKEKHPLWQEYLQKMEEYRIDMAKYTAFVKGVNDKFDKLIRECRFSLKSIEAQFNANPLKFWKQIEKNDFIIVMAGTISEILYMENKGVVISNDKVVINFYFEDDNDLLPLIVGEKVELLGIIESSKELESPEIESAIKTKTNSNGESRVEERTTIVKNRLFFKVISSFVYDREKALNKRYPEFEAIKKRGKPVEPVKPNININTDWESLSKH